MFCIMILREDNSNVLLKIVRGDEIFIIANAYPLLDRFPCLIFLGNRAILRTLSNEKLESYVVHHYKGGLRVDRYPTYRRIEVVRG